MAESFAAYAVQPTRDCRKSIEQLPKPSQLPARRVLTRLGKWVSENPDRVVPRGGGFVYRHPDPRVEITYCVDRENEKLRATWVTPSLERRVLIFISYSHRDRKWLDTLKTYLTLLEDNGNVRAWEDKQITSGQEWRVAIDEALAGASITLMLVTQDFIASKFIQSVELPQLLDHRDNGRLEAHWVLIRPCTYHDTPLCKIQALCKAQPLAGMTKVERERALVEIYDELKASCERLTGAPFKSSKFPEKRRDHA
jgi:hypothetical protein